MQLVTILHCVSYNSYQVYVIVDDMCNVFKNTHFEIDETCQACHIEAESSFCFVGLFHIFSAAWITICPQFIWSGGKSESADGQQSTFFAARKNEVSAIPTVNPAGKTRVPAPWISQDHLTRRFTTIRPALALESPKVWWISPYKTTARGRSDRQIRQFFRRGAFRKVNHRVAEKKDPMLTSKQTVNNLSKANDM